MRYPGSTPKRRLSRYLGARVAAVALSAVASPPAMASGPRLTVPQTGVGCGAANPTEGDRR
ncbi:MAG: hypothetical protein QOD14_609 [Solirubrobacterales bacterium]|jgi:hypothetical protein|nr:hypothetical protein [Solirubrobacterales bacterium]